MNERYDLAVIGAGSGGTGAALAGARMGLSVLLVEKAGTIGGNVVRGGVSCWEAGVGGTGEPFEIYRRLQRIPAAVGVYSYGRHICWHRGAGPAFPGGEHRIDPHLRYLDTLQRHSPRPVALATNEAYCREHWHGVVFEPDAYVQVVERMLAETGQCTVLRNAALERVGVERGRITSLRLSREREVCAIAYVDATGDGTLCQAAGCEAVIGKESRDAFGEPHAPEQASNQINGATLIYRVTPTDEPGIEPLPDDVPVACWWRDRFPVVSVVQYPCGDLNMNMLPTVEGREVLRLGYEAAYAEARRRVLTHWHHLQSAIPEFRGYRLSWIAPTLGVRETRRIVGEYVLTEHDLLAGLEGQGHPDLIALADHGIDVHGQGGGYRNLLRPYGVPYRCLVPRGFRNLLIACRAASFSAIAASSCRLSRTMMQLGQAAGTAVALAAKLAVDLPDVPPVLLQQELRGQHVQLDWPLPGDLIEYLCTEDGD